MRIAAPAQTLPSFMPPVAHPVEGRPLPSTAVQTENMKFSPSTASSSSPAQMTSTGRLETASVENEVNLPSEALAAFQTLSSLDRDPLSAHAGLDQERVMRLIGLLD